MTRFRHDLILRMIKLLDAVLMTIPFAMCWYLYYAKRVASPYYAKGDYLVVALFFVLFIIFGRVYDAFLMSMQRISEIIYEQFFKWNAAYEAAKLYFEENGSLNVPIGYTTPDGIALGKWVARQQYAYKSPNNSNCKLTPARVTLLEKIGMQWEKTDPWQHKYDLAWDYLQMHGNLQIPAKYKTADGIWLGRWLYDQKVLLRKQSPRLSAEQTNKLRKLLDEGTAGKAC